MAKSKVAPIRPLTIPRLELCSAVLLAKIMKQFLGIIGNQFIIKRIQLWTDSKIVLAWLNGHPSKWAVFVSNRVCQILDLAPNLPWRHVPSEFNPADIVSRGTDPNQLQIQRLWWHGPDWLCLPDDQWPVHEPLEATEEERKQKTRLNCLSVMIGDANLDSLLENTSSLTRLVRITAYCRRFLQIALKRISNPGYLSSNEMKASQECWIRYVQRKEFSREISLLNQAKSIHSSSKLMNLNPFLDGNGILRVSGRLAFANMSFNEKFPIILPNNSKLTELIIDQMHKATMHGELQLVLASLRRNYWILNARNCVKKYVHNCMICYKLKAKTSTQLMASLPSPRVNISRPFTHTGIDYCGPVSIKDRKGRGGRVHKGYFAIFICLAVKAIHIEVVNDLSTETFLAAFRRFVSRRGMCSDVYTDCGTNFVGANAELKRIFCSNKERILGDAANRGITWHFNPPASPHFGGLWEAGVKSMKSHLRKTLGNAILTYEELCTTVTQIEACLNSRPLCPLSDDPTDASALTPGHFLIGDTFLNVPEASLLDININYLTRWQLTQRLAQMFWKRWSSEYIARLQQRPKWLSIEVSPQVGDLCLLRDERLPSYKWPLARITELHPGKDSLVRVVTVLKNGNLFKRNITKIALLPVARR